MTINNFSTIRLGNKISSYRKTNNYTQGELAEQLGVSHQAISSWENGLTCPDISKLSDLSRIFSVSIDELLENETMASAINKIESDEQLNEEEIVSVAPITKPTELDRIIENADLTEFGFKTIVTLAPFTEKEQLHNWVDLYCKEIRVKELTQLAPFIDSKKISDIVNKIVFDKDCTINEIVSLAPFMEKNDVDKLVVEYSKNHSISKIVAIAPFMGVDSLDRIVKQGVEDKTISLKEIVPLAPFISKDLLKSIVDREIMDGDMKSILPLIPFIK